jgi:hypothetical protein
MTRWLWSRKKAGSELLAEELAMVVPTQASHSFLLVVVVVIMLKFHTFLRFVYLQWSYGAQSTAIGACVASK